MDIKITRENLVDLFTTATYGSDWLAIKTLKNERHLDEQHSAEYDEYNRVMERISSRRFIDKNK